MSGQGGAKAPAGGYGSLRRGLEILALVQDRGRVTVAEISRAVALPLSTTYRYVGALREAGFLLDDAGLVVPSPRLAEPNSENAHLVDLCGPVLRGLRARTGLTALVLVRVHTMALCLDVAPSPKRHRIFFQRGQTRPLYAGGSALPLLAFAPPGVVQEVVDHAMRRYTSATPSPADLRAVLEEVRASGVSVSRGHVTPGLVAYGVPVIVGGRCVCALSLVGEESEVLDPATGLDPSRLIAELRSAAAELAAALPPTVLREAWSDPDE